MSRWRIARLPSEESPGEPWAVSRLVAYHGVYGPWLGWSVARRLPTWREAVDWLVANQRLLDPDG